MVNPKLDEITRTIKNRDFDKGRELASELIDSSGIDEETERAALRLRAKIFARTRFPRRGVEDLRRIMSMKIAESEDYFLAAQYLLREDAFDDTLAIIHKYRAEMEDDPWFSEEFVVFECYCKLKLGDRDVAHLLSDVPDDIRIIFDPRRRPISKKELVTLLST